MMMKHGLIVALAAVLTACSSSEKEEPWALKGTVKGTIYSLNEYGGLENSPGGTSLTFKSDAVTTQANENASGQYEIKDLPMGTYDVVLEKAGYASMNMPGLRVVGGENPLYTNYTLTRRSTSTITGLTATTINTNISVSGTVSHNYPNSYPFIQLVIFVGTSPDVSPTKYTTSSIVYFEKPSGQTFTTGVFIDKKASPSGSTAYMVAYGIPSSYYSITNADTGLREFFGLSSQPSNVASILIP